MSRYKIHIDKNPKTKEEHEKDMNFEKLMGDYKKYYSPFKTRRLMFTDRKLIMLFVIIIALILALYTSLKHPPKDENKQEQKTESSETTGFTPDSEGINNNLYHLF